MWTLRTAVATLALTLIAPAALADIAPRPVKIRPVKNTCTVKKRQKPGEVCELCSRRVCKETLGAKGYERRCKARRGTQLWCKPLDKVAKVLPEKGVGGPPEKGDEKAVEPTTETPTPTVEPPKKVEESVAPEPEPASVAEPEPVSAAEPPPAQPAAPVDSGAPAKAQSAPQRVQIPPREDEPSGCAVGLGHPVGGPAALALLALLLCGVIRRFGR